MDMNEIHDYARRLLDAHGDKYQARDWRRIQAAIKEMRGPHES